MKCCNFSKGIQHHKHVAKRHNKQPNKALHPTAYSFVPFARSSLQAFASGGGRAKSLGCCEYSMKI